MKKSTIVGIILAVLTIIALCVLAAFLTWQYRDQLLPSPEETTESDMTAAVQTLPETEKKEETTEKRQEIPEPETSAAPIPSVIWVGDSRTLGMQKAVANSDVYIGAAGEGYKWFSETGLAEMEKAIKAHPDSVVVFNFGVNDYDNLDKYIELYTSILSEHPDTHFYFLSVNPIDPELCGNITNEEIADFNSHLRELSPDTYLDSYTEIKAEEIQTIDGVHYSPDDYRFIYNYAVGQIARRE